MQRIDSGPASVDGRPPPALRTAGTLRARLAWIVVLLMSALVLSYSLALYVTMGKRAGAETESARPWVMALLPGRMDEAADERSALRDLAARLDAMAGIRHLRIELRGADGSLIASAPRRGSAMAAWLQPGALSGRPERKPVTLDGRTIAYFDVAADGTDEFREMWADYLRSSLLVVLLSALAGLAIVKLTLRAFEPVEHIRGALRRLGHGEHGTRLPRFASAEMDEIATAFNRMAGEIEAAQAERQSLMRKLLDEEERTRRTVARELHDHLSPYLVALQPLGHLLRERCPRGPGAEDLAGITETMVAHQSTLLSRLRGILVGLRPPELETLGLRGAIEQFVAQRGREAGERARIDLAIGGDWPGFDPVLDAHIYLMVQDGLNDALGHASTHCIRLRIAHDGQAVEIALQHDGSAGACGTADDARHRIGTRERCLALGGRFDRRQAPDGGWQLSIRLPTQREPMGAAA